MKMNQRIKKLAAMIPSRKKKTSTAKKVAIGAGAALAVAGLVGAALKANSARKGKTAAASAKKVAKPAKKATKAASTKRSTKKKVAKPSVAAARPRPSLDVDRMDAEGGSMRPVAPRN